MSISSLVEDWNGFEQLIAKLHETGNVTVERDVVLTGRSGAPRQIDVLVRHKQGLYEHLVVVECKYWNSAIERLHVDALTTTIREVGADRGVIFSTSGFQSGAIAQAKQDNIELFKVREPTDLEWGAPGRFFDLWLHYISTSVGNLKFPESYAQPNSMPMSPALNVKLGFKDAVGTPIQISGKEVTLEGLIEKTAHETATKAYQPAYIEFTDDGYEGEIRFLINVNIQPPEPIKVLVNGGIVFTPKVTFDLGVSVFQNRLQHDRGKHYLFVLAVEDCIRNAVSLASRKQEKDRTIIQSVNLGSPSDPDDIYINGSIAQIWIGGFQPFNKFTGLEPGVAMEFLNEEPVRIARGKVIVSEKATSLQGRGGRISDLID